MASIAPLSGSGTAESATGLEDTCCVTRTVDGAAARAMEDDPRVADILGRALLKIRLDDRDPHPPPPDMAPKLQGVKALNVGNVTADAVGAAVAKAADKIAYANTARVFIFLFLFETTLGQLSPLL